MSPFTRCLSLGALIFAGCGDSGGAADGAVADGDTAVTTATDTTPGDTGASDSAVSDAPPTDASTTPPSDTTADAPDTITPGCDREGLDIQRGFFFAGDTYAYAITYTTRGTAPYDRAALYLFPSVFTPDAFDGPGSYPIGATVDDQAYQTCSTCFFINQGCGSQGCDHLFFATNGGIEIEAADAEGRSFTATLVDVLLREQTVNEEAGLVFTRPNGDVWCVDDVTITVTPECLGTEEEPDADDDCADAPGSGVCDESRGWCLSCIGDVDCPSSVAPACRSDGSFIPLCGGIGTCASDDAYEDNDGPSQAAPLTLGTPLTASACLRGDYNDWYSFDLAEPTNVEAIVTWANDPEIYSDVLSVAIWSDDGERVDDLVQFSPDQEGASATGHRLAPGTYYVNVRFYYPGAYFPDEENPTLAYTLTTKATAPCDDHAACGADAVCVDSVCHPVRCDREGFTPEAEGLYADFTSFDFVYAAKSAFGGVSDNLAVEFRSYEGRPAPIEDGPGAYPIGVDEAERRYGTCATCVTAGSECYGAFCVTSFMAVDGVADITTFDTASDRIAGTLDAVFIEVRGGPDSTVIRDARTWCVEGLAFDTAPECADDEACAEGERCLARAEPPLVDICPLDTLCYAPAAAAECVRCVEDDDCDGDPAGAFCSPSAFACTECGTHLDCPATAPVCGYDLACGTVDGCVADDAFEPGDDGPSGATVLPIGDEAHQMICGDPNQTGVPESDWFLVSVNAPLQARLGLAWSREQAGRDVGALQVIVYDSALGYKAGAFSERSPIILDFGLLPGRTYVSVQATNVPANEPLDYELRVIQR